MARGGGRLLRPTRWAGRLAGLLACLLLAGCQQELDPPVKSTLTESYRLVNQDSAAAAFPSDFRGSPTVVSYIYTECPGVCPRITANMKNIRSKLDDPASVDFVSITFDPKRDTPSKLAKYKSDFGLDGTSWAFLTGDPATIDSLMGRMDIRRRRKPVPDSVETDSLGYTFNHTNQINLIDGQGRVRAEYGGSMTPPKYVVQDIRKVID